MGDKAAVLYDFEAQPGSNELNIHAGETLTITNRDIGEGWWEGINKRGEKGLFPESYVEAIAAVASPVHAPPPAVAPPPLPTEYTSEKHYQQQHVNNDANNGWSNPNAAGTGSGYDDWGSGYDATATSTYAAAAPNAYSQAPAVAAAAGAAGGDEFFGDDWDDSSDEGGEGGGKAGGASSAAAATAAPRKALHSLESNASSSQEHGRSATLSSTAVAPSGVRLNLNRFSNFVKSGMENYLLGRTKANVPDDQIAAIIIAGYGGAGDGAGDAKWMPANQPYDCEVSKPIKDTKLKGLKSFMVYQLQPSFTSVQVPRRYKHFDWLHARLVDKFLLVPVPALPDKQISGRYQDEFLAHRQRRLQQWVSYVCRHPLLGECDVWKHFLTCTDEKRWKEGKRKAEKDELVGAAFLLSVRPPNVPLHSEELDAESDSYLRFVRSMDDAVRITTQHLSDNAKRHVGPFKREYQRLGQGFTQLGNSFEQDPKRVSPALTEAVKTTGQVYEHVGELFAQQPKLDSEPLLDSLALFKGILTNLPETLTLQKAARQKVSECQKMADEGKMPASEQAPLQHRADVLSYAVMAEMNNFQSERVYQMKSAIQSYLDEQINFYQEIVKSLQTARAEYDEI